MPSDCISQAVNNKLCPVKWTLSFEIDTWVAQPEDKAILRDISLGKVRALAAKKNAKSLYSKSDPHQTQVLSRNFPRLVGLTTISTSANTSSHASLSTSPTRQRPYIGAINKSQKSASEIPVDNDVLRSGRGKSDTVQRQSSGVSSLLDWENEAKRRGQDEEVMFESRDKLEQDRVSMEIDRKTTISKDEPTKREIDLPLVFVKRNIVYESPLTISLLGDCWTVITTLNTIGSTKLADIRTVLQWLEIILGKPADEDLLRPETWSAVLARGD
ncbi:hypothetical protein MMC27_001800 [Xylographa pallens]|nr:hypothetical protein [Xylographa pallens]